MPYRCSDICYRILGVLLVFTGLSGVAGAQPSRVNCKYRDAKGNCTSTPPFTVKKPKPPQRIVIESDPPGAGVWLDGQKLHMPDPPGAEVWFDGQKLDGLTPLTLDKPIRPGSHALRIAKPNHVAHEETITVRTYGRQVFHTRLQPWPIVRISRPENDNGNAPAALRIDGRPMGGDWWNKDIPLSPGAHYIEVEQAGYENWEWPGELQQKELQPGETYVHTPVLKKITGSIVIETNLIDVPVYLVPTKECENSHAEYSSVEIAFWGRVGPERLTRRNLNLGDYCVEFRIDGSGVQRHLLSVVANEETPHRFKLSPPDKPEIVTLDRFLAKWQKNSAWDQCQAYTKKTSNPSLGEKCLRLGIVYHKDKHDLERATKAYHSACQAGSAQACEIYGWLLLNGKGGLERNEESARDFYKKACNLGLERACYARHAPSNEKFDDPSRYYTLVSSQTDSDSLYDAWFSLKLSSWPTGLNNPGSSTIWGNWNGTLTLQVDLPLADLSSFKPLRYLGGTYYEFILGLESGLGRFSLPINDIENSQTETNLEPLAEAALRLKLRQTRNVHISLETGFNNFGVDFGATVAYRFDWLLDRGWDGKVGLEVTSLPTLFRDGQPTGTKPTLRAFVSIGSAIGLLVDKLPGG